MIIDLHSFAQIPGAADAPTLESILGDRPSDPSSSVPVPVFRGGVESFDWIRLAWLALGLVIGWKVLR